MIDSYSMLALSQSGGHSPAAQVLTQLREFAARYNMHIWLLMHSILPAEHDLLLSLADAGLIIQRSADHPDKVLLLLRCVLDVCTPCTLLSMYYLQVSECPTFALRCRADTGHLVSEISERYGYCKDRCGCFLMNTAYCPFSSRAEHAFFPELQGVEASSLTKEKVYITNSAHEVCANLLSPLYQSYSARSLLYCLA